MSHQHLAIIGALAREAMEHTRHQPEQTLLYQVIEEHYPEFLSHLSELDKTLPQYVQTEFEEYLKCGRLDPIPWRVCAEQQAPRCGDK